MPNCEQRSNTLRFHNYQYMFVCKRVAKEVSTWSSCVSYSATCTVYLEISLYLKNVGTEDLEAPDHHHLGGGHPAHSLRK